MATANGVPAGVAGGAAHGDGGGGLPMAGVRVVDMSDGRAALCGRYLSDLGADVLLVEPPGGTRSRRAAPAHAGTGISFVATSAGKRSTVVDLDSAGDRRRLRALLEEADIWIEWSEPGRLAAAGLDPEDVRASAPHLVVLSLSEFGRTGPYRDWVATDWVHMAMGGTLSRSGVPGRPPFMPPGDLADAAAGAQAAWAVVLAYWHRLETGVGDGLDLSVFEASVQVLDPPFGVAVDLPAGSERPAGPRGRPQPLTYPIFPCADGRVRVMLYAPRQWRSMWTWLGEPEEFADRAYDDLVTRFRAADRLYPLIAELLRDQPAGTLVAEGQRRGVPIAPVLRVADVLGVDHFLQRGTFADVGVEGSKGRLPAGLVVLDGRRAAVRGAAPEVGGGTEGPATGWPDRAGPAPPAAGPAGGGRRPLSGLRVLDLGVIVMGAEAGRLLADQGADVIKVENRSFPDVTRGPAMSAYFAAGHRNKRGLGINLRDPAGAALFERFVAVSDVVLSNFRPGTLDALGLGAARLREVNPGAVVVTSSAMGEWGPWRDWMGYGPLVRAVAGVTDLWRDPEVDGGYGDTTTIFPDHFVARVVATATIAALAARRRTGTGSHVEVSQAEAIVNALAPLYLRESLEPGAVAATAWGELDAPWGVYPCAGDDEWCVVTVRHDADWARLVGAVGSPAWAAAERLRTTAGRLAWRREVDEGLAAWTSARTPGDVARTLQEAGVPAGAMQRPAEVLVDPHLAARGFYARFRQPGVEGEVVAENGPVHAGRTAGPPSAPAPLHGEHTRELCRELLGMDDGEVDELVATGVLEEPPR